MNQPSIRQRPQYEPVLTFSALAWLKLQFFCHSGPTEIGGFGVSAKEDLLYVEDFQTVRQEVTSVSVRFDDGAVADWFDRCVDQGIPPARCGRIWLHTHPGASVTPSSTDEDTFERVFGLCDWSVMFILGRTGNTYARLAFSAGPGGSFQLPVQVDWSSWPQVCETEAVQSLCEWQSEYEANIQPLAEPVTLSLAGAFDRRLNDHGWGFHPWQREMMHEFLAEDIYDREFACGPEAARREATRDRASRPFD